MEPVMVMGISGPIRGGKGTAVKILQTILGDDLCVASTRVIIERKLREYGVTNPQDRTAKQEGFTRIAKTEGDRWIHAIALNIWEENRRPVWLLDAVLMGWDDEFVRSFSHWMHFHITAPLEVRWRRAVQAAMQGEPDSKPDEGNMTLEEFKGLHEHKTARDVNSFETKQGVTVIRNTGSANDLGAGIIVALMNRGLVTSEEINRKKRALQELYYSIGHRD